VINRAARPALDLLSDQLDVCAEALRNRDRDSAQRALERLRENKEELATLGEAIEGAKETSTLSPARWRRRRLSGVKYGLIQTFWMIKSYLKVTACPLITLPTL
jgi:hypothetical protein